MSMQRFLVRRRTAEVFVWTEILSKHHSDLEEVYAANADEAVKRHAMPDVTSVSVDQLEAMDKASLLIFASVKLGLKLDAAQDKAGLLDNVKEALFTRNLQPAEAKLALTGSRTFANAADMKGKTGDPATVQGTGKFAAPAGAEANVTGAAGASDRSDQPLRS